MDGVASVGLSCRPSSTLQTGRLSCLRSPVILAARVAGTDNLRMRRARGLLVPAGPGGDERFFSLVTNSRTYDFEAAVSALAVKRSVRVTLCAYGR